MPAIESYPITQIKDPDGRVISVNKVWSELKDYEKRGFNVPKEAYEGLTDPDPAPVKHAAPATKTESTETKTASTTESKPAASATDKK